MSLADQVARAHREVLTWHRGMWPRYFKPTEADLRYRAMALREEADRSEREADAFTTTQGEGEAK